MKIKLCPPRLRVAAINSPLIPRHLSVIGPYEYDLDGYSCGKGKSGLDNIHGNVKSIQAANGGLVKMTLYRVTDSGRPAAYKTNRWQQTFILAK